MTASGNAQPTGTVKIVVRRAAGGAKFKGTFAYSGGVVKFKTGKLTKPGKYKVKVKYKPTPNSVFQKSKAKSNFKVKRKK